MISSALRVSDMSELFVILSENGIEFEREVRLSEISSFRIGGIAAYAIYPKSAEELIFTVRLAKEKGIRHKVIGNTTNILFSDKGFDGALIFTKRIRDISITPKGDNADVICGAGVPLPLLAAKMRDRCLSGAEFASGIPATVGGAVVMNAGAHG
ncbi:MAG: FAD-binding protein, partial [Ruminococcaceae bacterium]|nr:FAD-binding protein [Oscillospiraceae bacterium]